MNKVSTEKKLELAKMLRSESRQNDQKIRGREQLLYGRVPYENKEEAAFCETDTDKIPSLKLRLFAACLLFGAFVAWDNGYYPMLPANDGQIYGWIADENGGLNMFAFMEDFTYTLEGNK